MARPVLVVTALLELTDPRDVARRLAPPWVAVGNFDGLHVGHARVVGELVARARAAGAPALVLTFRPHPASVVGSRGAPARLLSDRQRAEILASWGADAVLWHPFDARLAELLPGDFVTEVLSGALVARGVVVGEDFRFGRGRTGDLSHLRAGLSAIGATAIGVPPVMAGGTVVSSTRIRALVVAGEDERARELLGRPFILEGVVVEGDRRGRAIGFPTANIEAPGFAVPARGVHACVLRAGASEWPAVANVGERPTFGGGRECVEVHALGDPGDLYGHSVRVAFLAKLRDERAFGGAAELREQIARDIDAARERLAALAPAPLAGPGF